MNGLGFVAPPAVSRASGNLSPVLTNSQPALGLVSKAPSGTLSANAPVFSASMRQPFVGNRGAGPKLQGVQSLRAVASPQDDPEPPHENDTKNAVAKGLKQLRAANAMGEDTQPGKLIEPFRLTPAGKAARQVIKRGMYAQLALGHSAQILAGKSQPLIEFRVEHSPPSLFINYRIKPDRLDDFRKAFNIPDDIKMMPMQCIKDGEAGYLLSINVYAVSGITNGLRAEESVYIDRGDGKASYLVLGATTDNFSMDPVDVLTMAGDLKYENTDDKISISYSNGKKSKYEFKCSYHADGNQNKQSDPLAPWIAANDFIYWPNGVCDRAFYNGDLINEPVDLIAEKDVKTKNTLPWAEFVEPEPVEVFALKKPLDFVISPWHNVD